MATQIAIVRSFSQDKPLPQSYIYNADSMGLAQLPYFPVLVDSVVVETDPPFSVDGDTGIVTFDPPLGSGPFTILYKSVLISDADIQNFIDVEASDDMRLAAADTLDAMASNQTIILKKIKMLDLETDGPSMSAALRAHAASLRAQVFDPNMVEPDFEIAEQILDDFGWREKIYKDYERES